MAATGIGAAVPRREDARLLDGAATYVVNLTLPGMLHCAFVRSPVAHGVLRGVDLSAVREAPGVVAAYDAADLDLAADAPPRSRSFDADPHMHRPLLPDARVRFAGEPLAVIVAEDPAAAADALELADVDVEPAPVAADIDAALAGDAVLFPEAGTNVAVRAEVHAGDRGAVERYPVRVDLTVEHPRLAAVPLEPLGVVARPEHDGGLTVWVGHQSPWAFRTALARALRLEPDRLRVVVPDVGGAFGAKNGVYPEQAAAAACARRLGRPVRWVATRSENLLLGTHGRGQRHHVTLAGERDGRVRALRLDVVGDLGAYPQTGAAIPVISAAMATGPYDIAHVEAGVRGVVTNRAPTGAYRGAGRPEATLTIERAMDAFAHAAGLDPVEVRRRNFVPAGAMPYDSPSGARYDSGDYAAALDAALAHVDLGALRAEQRRRLSASEPLLGIGVTAFVERAGGPASGTEFGGLELTGDGRFVVRVGSMPFGQGLETSWSQIVADVFGLDGFDDVQVVSGDTDEIADGSGSYGSRSAQVGGSALLRCAQRLRERLVEQAAEMLECAPGDVDAGGGAVHVRGDPATAIAWADVARAAAGSGTELRVEEQYSPNAQTFPYGIYVAVVEVDRDTGRVTVRDLVAVDDCGTVLNPMIVEGQVHGSAVQGLGQALYEEFSYSDEGQPLTSTLLDYTIPAAPDVPALRTDRLHTPAPTNPLGAKGTGEAGCIGAPPAVVCAVLDALRPLGVTGIDVPMTPLRVWRAIRAAAAR